MALIALLLSAALPHSVPMSPEKLSPAVEQRAETYRRYGLDPGSSLASRVGETPASVLEMFAEPGTPAPTPHALTPAERKQLSAALDALPPLHRRILSERLRTLSFLDGMPNTALTSTVNPDGDDRLFDISIRAGIFRQTMSEWLTEKERTCFDSAGSALEVSVEAGALPAIVGALLHEATHIVDSSLRITPAPATQGGPRPTPARASSRAACGPTTRLPSPAIGIPCWRASVSARKARSFRSPTRSPSTRR